jgi:hypothetical protein
MQVGDLVIACELSHSTKPCVSHEFVGKSMKSRMQTSQGVPEFTATRTRVCQTKGPPSLWRPAATVPAYAMTTRLSICFYYVDRCRCSATTRQSWSELWSLLFSFLRPAHPCMNLAYSLFVGCPHLVSSWPLGRRNRMLLTLGMLLAISLPNQNHASCFTLA